MYDINSNNNDHLFKVLLDNKASLMYVSSPHAGACLSLSAVHLDSFQFVFGFVLPTACALRLPCMDPLGHNATQNLQNGWGGVESASSFRCPGVPVTATPNWVLGEPDV